MGSGMKKSLITNRTLASIEENAKTRLQEAILGRTPSNVSRIGSRSVKKLMGRGKGTEGF
jgi:hypothetical protein